MIVLLTIVAIILSALLYRCGGLGREGNKRYPFIPKWVFDTKARDIGCSLVCLGWMALFYNAPIWAHAVSFILMFGALTTYWDKIFKFDNYWFHGFMIALAYFPYAIASGSWVGFGIRCFVTAVLVGTISELVGEDDTEELSRGGILAGTLPFMLL